MVVLGADRGGFCLRGAVIVYLGKNSVPYHDYGCYDEEPVDYMLPAPRVVYDVTGGRAEKGILCCGMGIEISIAANKVKGIRAVVCTNEFCAEATCRYNDANISCMGGRVTDEEMAVKPTKIFLETPFDGGWYARRIAQTKEIEDGEKL